MSESEEVPKIHSNQEEAIAQESLLRVSPLLALGAAFGFVFFLFERIVRWFYLPTGAASAERMEALRHFSVTLASLWLLLGTGQALVRFLMMAGYAGIMRRLWLSLTAGMFLPLVLIGAFFPGESIRPLLSLFVQASALLLGFGLWLHIAVFNLRLGALALGLMASSMVALYAVSQQLLSFASPAYAAHLQMIGELLPFVCGVALLVAKPRWLVGESKAAPGIVAPETFALAPRIWVSRFVVLLVSLAAVAIQRITLEKMGEAKAQSLRFFFNFRATDWGRINDQLFLILLGAIFFGFVYSVRAAVRSFSQKSFVPNDSARDSLTVAACLIFEASASPRSLFELMAWISALIILGSVAMGLSKKGLRRATAKWVNPFARFKQSLEVQTADERSTTVD